MIVDYLFVGPWFAAESSPLGVNNVIVSNHSIGKVFWFSNAEIEKTSDGCALLVFHRHRIETKTIFQEDGSVYHRVGDEINAVFT